MKADDSGGCPGAIRSRSTMKDHRRVCGGRSTSAPRFTFSSLLFWLRTVFTTSASSIEQQTFPLHPSATILFQVFLYGAMNWSRVGKCLTSASRNILGSGASSVWLIQPLTDTGEWHELIIDYLALHAGGKFRGRFQHRGSACGGCVVIV